MGLLCEHAPRSAWLMHIRGKLEHERKNQCVLPVVLFSEATFVSPSPCDLLLQPEETAGGDGIFGPGRAHQWPYSTKWTTTKWTDLATSATTLRAGKVKQSLLIDQLMSNKPMTKSKPAKFK